MKNFKIVIASKKKKKLTHEHIIPASNKVDAYEWGEKQAAALGIESSSVEVFDVDKEADGGDDSLQA